MEAIADAPESPWVQQAIARFFAARTAPTRSQCDRLALDVAQASAVRSVDVPGALSYTVICTRGQSSEDMVVSEDIVVSFREVGSPLHPRVVALAAAIHGDLVPQHATDHGLVPGADPPLRIYTMPRLPGVACIDVLSYEADMDAADEDRHVAFVEDLARYFARCWAAPQPVAPSMRAARRDQVARRLAILRAEPSLLPVVPEATLAALEAALPRLFDDLGYPQVLTHGDLSKTNVLVDPGMLRVTGLVDWSLAGTQPFGLELDSLWLMTGCMDLRGWHFYACRPRLVEAFWAAFWAATGDVDNDQQAIRETAETAAKIGAVLRCGFDRNVDGTPSEVVTTSKSMLAMLRAFLDESL